MLGRSGLQSGLPIALSKGMILHALVALAITAPLAAQQIQLSTTADGSTLYFVTQAPRRVVEEPWQGRIYTFTSDGLTLFAQRDRVELPADPGQPRVTNYCSYTAAEVSSNGGTLAVTASRQCLSGRDCLPVLLTQTVLRGETERTVQGRVQFSANARWMLRFREPNLIGGPGGLVDLQAGTERNLDLWESDLQAGLLVANDGSVVRVSSGTLELLRPGAASWERLTSLMNEDVRSASIDPEARFVVFTSRWSYPHHAYLRLRIARLPPTSLTTLIEGFADYYQPILSHDGRRALFLTNDPRDNSGTLTPPQTFVVDIDGTSLRRLTDDPCGIQKAILSGNGRVAYALSRSGRLLRIDVDSGVQTELLPPSIQVFTSPRLAAGSRVDIEAFDDPAFGISLGGQALPVNRRSPGRFSFVVPSDLAGQMLRLRAESSLPAGPFKPQLLDTDSYVFTRLADSLLLPEEYGGPGAYGFRFSLAYDEGYNRLITPFEPAPAGSVVNVLATGLGPVEPATGALTEPLSCRWFQPAAGVPISLLSAGLHPSEPGVYELRFRIPDDIPPGMTYEGALQIACSFDSPSVPVSSDLILLIPYRR